MVIVWFFTFRKYGASGKSLGFKVSWDPRQIPVIIGALVATLFINSIYETVIFLLTDKRPPEQPVMELFGNNVLLAFIVVAVVAPITEEIFFRGFIYTGIRNKLGVRNGVILSSAIFSIFHVIPELFVELFVIGVALALLFEYRKTLITPIILHALNNSIALLYLYYS